MATFPAIRTRRWRRIIAHFLSKGASSRDKAIAWEPQNEADRSLFEDLRARGVVKQDNRGGFYVDMDAYGRDAEIRGRIRTGAIVATLLGMIGGAAALRKRRG
ncbi:hypothetical protein [Stakelama saccharophila]|uniref:Uncharacterized protein n=1 Tax=Stakelama saccharophila TaxID=3075605 RepID=A0ABZ0B875_9SPHN|nr:hypothetical protein [Stakelama sp. W311]WNO53311.1 hypothetical protein RPR59_12790 [Stakelama sp. W311]